MILKGSQRGGALQLARHLMNAEENEHVEVYDLRGFVSDTSLRSALQEVVAISKGTRCQQMLFSLSLNPPIGEAVPITAFEAAIGRVEEKLGLEDQARAIVFHEKEGRRHAHVVWSRIDVQEMKAINLPHFKLKLKDISRDLFLEHGWTLPDGFRDKSARDPMSFSREEWQQARRAKQDPKELKALFQECWAVSDGRAAFEKALEERGFYLAKGDRRGFVAMDWRGEVYVLSRWSGQKTRELEAKLGDPSSLPTVVRTSPENKHFDDSARMALQGLMLFVADQHAGKASRNLVTVRDYLMQGAPLDRADDVAPSAKSCKGGLCQTVPEIRLRGPR